jgi:hypothetical protein
MGLKNHDLKKLLILKGFGVAIFKLYTQKNTHENATQ